MITIIIPTYNRQSLVQRAIRSAQEQTVKDIEILVCDDGSTDNTEKIVMRISAEDNRVKWIVGTHTGRPACPRNNGIKASRGKWVAFLDSDDYWSAKKLERQLSHAEKNNADACCTNALRIKGNSILQKPISSFSNQYITFNYLIKSNYVICSSVLIKKNILKTIGLFPVSNLVLEDYASWLRVCSITNFLFLNENLTFYNDDTEDSIRKKDIQNILLQKKYILENYLKWSFEHKFSIITARALVEYSKIRLKTLFKIIEKVAKKGQ
ncbi:MAG: hypothetical protein C0412_18150 [Flavobacterium sp.]|nr:hypothetical protein [Flavobacterium sp.]